MTTALDVVTRALRKIGVLAIDETAPAASAAHGLVAINDMMFAWKLAGVNTSHVALSLSDAFPLSAEFVEGTVYNLAARIDPDYKIPPAFDADDWFRKLQAAYAEASAVDMTLDSALVQAPSRTGLWY